MATKLGRRRLIRLTAQAAQDTAEAGTTELLCYDPKIDPDDNMIQREPAISSGGPYAAQRGPSVGKVTFKVELRSDGVSGLDAGLLVALRGCGLKATGLVLSPATTVADQTCVTLDVWNDGLHERLSCAMGTYELTGEWGKQVFASFTFSGLYEKLADEAMPVPTHTAAKPMLTKAATLTLGAATPRISKFSINPNNKVEPLEDITKPEGVAFYLVGASRRFEIGMDPLVEATADVDYRGLWLAQTLSAFTLGLSDGTVDVTIEAPKVQIMPPQQADRESKASYDLKGQCNVDTGDDELTITTSAA